MIGKSTFIDGQYYTVNPQAIRTTLDVYGENVRKIVPIESPQFGTVMTVWVGAMSTFSRARCLLMGADLVGIGCAVVGSIGTTAHEGDHVKRGDELGWFAFGMCIMLRPLSLLIEPLCRWINHRLFVRGRRTAVGRRSAAERRAEYRDARADGNGNRACDGSGNESCRRLKVRWEAWTI